MSVLWRLILGFNPASLIAFPTTILSMTLRYPTALQQDCNKKLSVLVLSTVNDSHFTIFSWFFLSVSEVHTMGFRFFLLLTLP